MWTKEEQDLIFDFIFKYYKEYYSILGNISLENFIHYLSYNNPNLIYQQIFSYVNILKYDRYKELVKMIKDTFNLDNGIIEVSSGVIPIISSMLRNYTNASIKAYDPRISLTIPTENISKFKQKFSIKDNDRQSLIIGINPCDATLLIAEEACKNNQDFFIALCDCTTTTNESFKLYNYKDILSFCQKNIRIIKEMVQDNNRTLLITNLDPNYGQKNPIIYSKKK